LFTRLSGPQAFILLFSLYCIGLAGILRADRLYLDDIGRALYGYADMAGAGRAVADLLSAVFHLDSGMVDASPFSQIVAAALTACAALLLCRALRVRPAPAVVAACLPFGLGPYGLENFSYRFDAPLAAAGVLLAVLPFRRLRGKFFVGAVPCLFASASIYQPCLNVYPAVAAAVLLRNISRGKGGNAALALRMAAPLLCASALYVLQLPLWLTDYQYGDHVAAHSAVPGPGLLPAAVAANIRTYCAMLYGDWSVNALGPLLLLALAAYCAASAVRMLGRRAGEALRRKKTAGREREKACGAVPGPAGSGAIAPAIAGAALLACLMLTPLGVQIVLGSPVWSPRTFLAFGPVLTLILLGITPTGITPTGTTPTGTTTGANPPETSARRLRTAPHPDPARNGLKKTEGNALRRPCPATAGKAARTAAAALILLIDVQLFIIAALYGNMLSAQNRWEQARFAGLVPVLAAFAAEKHSDRVVFADSVGYSPLMDVPGRRFPLIRRMTVVPLTRGMRWGYEQLAVYGVTARPGKVPAKGDILRPYADTPYFRLEATADDAAFVTFKQPPAPKPHQGFAGKTP
jgi:hypothetical protein